MPMSFPDMASLRNIAQVHNFRQPTENESEVEYRQALAAHVRPIDFVESEEIRNKVGWDKFSDKQNTAMIERKIGVDNLFDLLMKTDQRK